MYLLKGKIGVANLQRHSLNRDTLKYWFNRNFDISKGHMHGNKAHAWSTKKHMKSIDVEKRNNPDIEEG